MARYARFAERFFQNIALRGSSEWQVSCPFHGGHDSLQFNVNNGKFICFGCGRGGNIDNLTDGDVPDYTPSISELRTTLNRLQGRYPERMSLPVEWLAQYDVPHDYWDERGISREAQRVWGLGYDFEDHAVTIPLWAHDGGAIHGVIKRSLHRDALIRYRYPKGFVRRVYLYGEHKARMGGTVWLTEGALDAVEAWDAGATAVSVLGSSLSRSQCDRLLRLYPERIVLAFDNDKAGRDGIAKARRMLKGHQLSEVEWPRGVKDLGDLDLEDRIDLVKAHMERV